MRITREFITDPSCFLSLPLYKLDGASIRSEDARGHLCVVTGATWTSQGRAVDATDDYITLTAIQPMPAQGTISIWAYKSDWGGGGTRALFDCGDANNRFLLYRQTDNTSRLLITTVTVDQVDINGGVLSGAGWKYFEVLYGLNNTSLFIDLVQQGVTDTSCTMPTFAAGWVTRLGNFFSATNGAFGGTIGEVIIHNRQLTFPERRNLWLATKWRYR